jgi:SAM-dependent methyltransferase
MIQESQMDTTISSLDLGCGTAPQNPFSAAQCFGVDIRPSADANIKAADLFVDPIPFEDGRFNYVTAIDFMEHMPRVLWVNGTRFPFVLIMNEIYRVLKQGGIFLSATPAFPHPQTWQDPTHVNIITEGTFPEYFCTPNLTAAMYGFTGTFEMVKQEWNAHKLMTYLRKA